MWVIRESLLKWWRNWNRQNSASLSTKPAKKIGLCTKPAHQQLPTSNETFAPVPVCVKWVLCPSTCRCGMLPVEWNTSSPSDQFVATRKTGSVVKKTWLVHNASVILIRITIKPVWSFWWWKSDVWRSTIIYIYTYIYICVHDLLDHQPKDVAKTSSRDWPRARYKLGPPRSVSWL